MVSSASLASSQARSADSIFPSISARSFINSVMVNPDTGTRVAAIDYLQLRNTLLLVREHFGRYKASIRWLLGVLQLLRGLVRSGRLTRLSIGINDVPGQLAAVTKIIGDLGGNIVEVQHQRMFSDLSSKRTVLEVAVETRDRAHIDELVEALRSAGYHVDRAE